MLLIWYCKSATLNEKIAAWQEIVGYVPSCPWDDAWDIRERVAAYIELQEEMLGQFQSADSYVYQYKLIDSLTCGTGCGLLQTGDPQGTAQCGRAQPSDRHLSLQSGR